eukprot:scaffold19007_cov71-Phaeocystis_antarctica.AAC.2
MRPRVQGGKVWSARAGRGATRWSSQPRGLCYLTRLVTCSVEQASGWGAVDPRPMRALGGCSAPCECPSE